MSTTFSAIYEQGVIRLKEPLTLPEPSHIEIQILRDRLGKEESQSEAFTCTMEGLDRLLNSIDREWENDMIRQVFLILLQSDLRTLWKVSSPKQRTICALLELAVARLRPEMLTRTHINTFRAIFNTLQQPAITQDDIYACHDRMMKAGLSATFELSRETVQSYLDEL